MTTPTLQPSYGTVVALPFTSLDSLPTSASLVAGAQPTPPTSNSVNKYSNMRCFGGIKVGTTPTPNTQIIVYAYEAIDQTPNWPDTFGGADALVTLTDAALARGFLRQGACLAVNTATTGLVYPFDFMVFPLFGYMPRDIGFFVVHNTGQPLAASGHTFNVSGVNMIMPSL